MVSDPPPGWVVAWAEATDEQARDMTSPAAADQATAAAPLDGLLLLVISLKRVMGSSGRDSSKPLYQRDPRPVQGMDAPLKCRLGGAVRSTKLSRLRSRGGVRRAFRDVIRRLNRPHPWGRGGLVFRPTLGGDLA